MANLTQTQLDQEAILKGQTRFDKSISNLSEDQADSGHGRLVVRHYTRAIKAKLDEWTRFCETHGRASHASVYLLIKELPSHIISFITLLTVIGNLTAPINLASLRIKIGKKINEEFILRTFRKQFSKEFKDVSNLADRRSGYLYRRATFLNHLKKNNLLADLFWNQMDCAKVGAVLLSFVETTTNLLALRREGRATKTVIMVEPSNEYVEWQKRFVLKNRNLHPYFEPRVTQAPNWNKISISLGTTGLPAVQFIKDHRACKINQEKDSDLSQVYSAVNTIQATKWRVNKRVLLVATEVFKRNWSVGDISGSLLKEIPNKPADIAQNELARKAWRHDAALVHASNVPLKSKILQASETLRLANKFSTEDNVFFQYQLDFRGRVYAVNPFLNPQGTDLAKGLLEFADGGIINSQESLNWIKMHGANSFGVDKVSLEERYLWVDSNVEMIVANANDPLANTEWTTADSPFAFLAFCFEYRDFITEGFGFVSRLPIGIDGSNNGLQILSMLSRDDRTGLFTNCVPSNKPYDIYQIVADRVNEMLVEENSADARFWFDFGVNRKTCKKQVMTLPYGLTQYGCKDYCALWLRDELESRKIKMTPAEILHYGNFLGQKVWESIYSSIGRAKGVMDWLQDVAKQRAKDGKPVSWTTPMGLKIVQHYNKTVMERSKVWIMNKRIHLRIFKDTSELLSRRQVSGVSPNFVHSLDAACLQKTVLIGAEYGISSFAVVHDSFATTADKTTELGASVRMAYREIFSQDQLQNFINGMDLAIPIIEYGSLDIDKIIDSEYLFC